MKTKILLVYTGGTIGMVKDYENESLVPFDFENLLKHIPELKLIDCQIDYTGFDQPIDSSDLHPEQWIELAEIIELNYENYDGFVILHGTDTMSYSASALSFMLSGLQKPVIFTGSQLHLYDLKAKTKEKHITYLHFASVEKERHGIINEVSIYFEYRLLRANRTTKINAENYDAYDLSACPAKGQA